jgi:hypothetical protein
VSWAARLRLPAAPSGGDDGRQVDGSGGALATALRLLNEVGLDVLT